MKPSHVGHLPDMYEFLPEVFLSVRPWRDVRDGVACREVDRCEIGACWTESKPCERIVAGAAMMGVGSGSR